MRTRGMPGTAKVPRQGMASRSVARTAVVVTQASWGQAHRSARAFQPAKTRREELVQKAFAMSSATMTFTAAELLAAVRYRARSPETSAPSQQTTSDRLSKEAPQKNSPTHAEIVLQARATQFEAHYLQHELEACTQQRGDLQQDPILVKGAGASQIASTSWDFCPLTSEVLSDKDVEGMRKGFMQAITEHSKLLASCMSDDVLIPGIITAEEPCPNAALVASKAEVKRLRGEYEKLQAEITHLQIRICQARQLPAQPKRKITTMHVKTLVSDDLWTRTAQLRGQTSELAAAMRGM